MARFAIQQVFPRFSGHDFVLEYTLPEVRRLLIARTFEKLPSAAGKYSLRQVQKAVEYAFNDFVQASAVYSDAPNINQGSENGHN